MSTNEADHLVKVRRQPGDYRLATYLLEKVYRTRWDNVGGGIQQRSAMHVYGYVLCDEPCPDRCALERAYELRAF